MLQSATAQIVDLVRALALAWKNIAAYPRGHPARASSVGAAHQKLLALRGPAGEVVLGISADALIWGEERVEAPQVQKFAQTLFTRNVAVVRFASRMTEDDLETFLRLLVSHGNDERTPIWERLTAAGVASINLQPVDYSSVKVTDDLTLRIKKPESLWDEILKALIAGRELTAGARELLAAKPRTVEDMTALIMKYVDDASRGMPELDADATFGIRRVGNAPDPPELIRGRISKAIALHVGGATGTKKQLATQQILQLLRTFPEPLRGSIMRNVMRELATDEHSGSLLRDFVSELPSDEVLEALRYVQSIGKLSSHAVNLLTSLAAMSDRGKAPDIVPEQLVAELATLFADDDIDRFNPEEHSELVSTIEIPAVLSSQPTSVLGDRVDTLAPESVNRSLAQTLLDLLGAPGIDAQRASTILTRLENVFLSFMGASQFTEAADLIELLNVLTKTSQSAAVRDSIAKSVANLASPESMRLLIDRIIGAKPEAASLIRRVIDALGSVATRNLLEALAEENNRSRRRKLFDLVISLGPRIVDEAIPFLQDDRWYVVRNMIVLLRTVNDRRSLPEIRRIADHPDLRVRLEAIKTLLSFDSHVPRGLLDKAINDPDPKLAETAISLVGSYGIREGVDPLLRIVAGNDVFGTRTVLRVHAIRVLGELAEPNALPRLEKFFSNSFLPWPSQQERRAAYESLASYPAEARARFVELGLKSRDAAVRAICRKLAGS